MTGRVTVDFAWWRNEQIRYSYGRFCLVEKGTEQVELR